MKNQCESCGKCCLETEMILSQQDIDLIIEKLPELNVFMIGFVPESLKGFKDLKLYKEEVLTLEERSNNIDLPFFELNLTKTIKTEADKLIKIIKKLINSI